MREGDRLEDEERRSECVFPTETEEMRRGEEKEKDRIEEGKGREEGEIDGDGEGENRGGTEYEEGR